ncbi:unnamed protein product [Urochloa humidicola]
MGNSCATGAPLALLGTTCDPDFEWKVYGFSSLLQRGATPANSAPFHCCGNMWFLQVTPMHKKSGDGVVYLALDLAISRIGLKPGLIMNAVFELSMYNHSSGTYYGGKASYSFNAKKTHSKKMCLVPLGKLLKSSDFLVDDSCVFGVRILKADISSPKKIPVVISENPITVQNLFLQKKDLVKGTYTWTMNNYFDLKLPVNSPAFEVGEHKWYIRMHPLGDHYSTNSLSMYLHLHDPKDLPDPEPGMMIELALCILNQKYGKHFTVKGRFVFSIGSKAGWGWSDFMALNRFKDLSRGYLVGSNCILKADITVIGSSNDN